MDDTLKPENMPKHIAIIMDGNRRWAKQNNLDPKAGHKAGADTLEKIASYANKIGLEYMTVYAFSTENWKRTQEEVGALMLLLQTKLDEFCKRVGKSVKIQILGDVTKLPIGLQKSIYNAIEKTKNNTGLVLNIAFNYGGRLELVTGIKQIAQEVKQGKRDIDSITEEVISEHLYTKGMPDPDLLIRTSGELRTSNFLPWQLVYSEFYFVNKHWPAFEEEDLLDAIKEYQKRTRKFGAQ